MTWQVCVCLCCPGKRTAEGIIQWLKRRAGPGAAVLDSVQSAAQFIDAHNISVVGFFDVGLSICIYPLLLLHLMKYIMITFFYFFFWSISESGERCSQSFQANVLRFDWHRVCHDYDSWGFHQVWSKDRLSGALQEGMWINQGFTKAVQMLALLPSSA